jgi:uncharacterized protein YdhG (YjbR/CyaY superfamily)
MAKPEFKSVDAYIDAQPLAVRPALNQLREIIREAVPEAEETISYKIPAYNLQGGTVIYFAGWKKHTSIYPANKRVLQAFKKELATQDVNQSTIRFPLSKPLPEKLVASIAKFRAKEVAERERPKIISRKSSN